MTAYNGKKSFYSNIVKTLKAHYIDLGNFIENEKINIILDNIKNNYISHWKQQITNSTKLSFYCKSKKKMNWNNI